MFFCTVLFGQTALHFLQFILADNGNFGTTLLASKQDRLRVAAEEINIAALPKIIHHGQLFDRINIDWFAELTFCSTSTVGIKVDFETVCAHIIIRFVTEKTQLVHRKFIIHCFFPFGRNCSLCHTIVCFAFLSGCDVVLSTIPGITSQWF